MDLKLVREEAIEGTNRAFWDKLGFVPDPDSDEFEEEYRRQFELAKKRLALTHPTAPAAGAHLAPPPDPTNWAELTGESTQIRWAAALRAERVREIRDAGHSRLARHHLDQGKELGRYPRPADPGVSAADSPALCRIPQAGRRAGPRAEERAAGQTGGRQSRSARRSPMPGSPPLG